MNRHSPPRRSDQVLRRYVTVKHVMEQLDFSTSEACRAWLRRQGIVMLKRGRICVVDPLDVVAALHKRSA